MAITRSPGQGHLGKAKFIQQLFKDCSRDISGLHLHSIKLLNKDKNRENYKENSSRINIYCLGFFFQNNLDNLFIRKKRKKKKGGKEREKNMEVIQ